MNYLLLNRDYNVGGNWYAPKEYLLGFPSVIDVELINTSSSAGDWDGVLFQKINEKVYAIPFSQENNYPSSGFTIYTGEKSIFTCPINEFTKEMREAFIYDYCKLIY